MNDFRSDLTKLINRHSKENGSNTPDFILSQFLDACLVAFDVAIGHRTRWYGPDDHKQEEPATSEKGAEIPSE